MNKPTYILFILLWSVVLGYSCKTKKVIIDGHKEKIDNLNANKLMDSIEKHRLHFEYFQSKAGVELTTPNDNKSFKATLRIRKDSVIWVYIMKATLPVATVSITKDSIKMVNKIDKSYFISSFNYINETFGTELDFKMLQDLLTGNFLAYDPEQKYKEKEDSTYYFLSSVGKRKLKRAFEKDKFLKKEPYVFRYWINFGTYRPAITIINDLNDTTALEIHNKEFMVVDSTAIVPSKMFIKASDSKAAITIDLNFSKTKVNEITDFPFKIPEGYEKKQ